MNDYYRTKTIMNTTPTQPDWREEFVKKFVNDHGTEWRPLRGLWHEEVMDFIQSVANTSYEAGRKEEESRWINQPANEHDNRIRKEAVDTLRKRAVEELEKEIKNNKKFMNNVGYCDACMEEHYCVHEIRIEVLEEAQQKVRDL